jgi:hypothetical protein
MELIYPSYGGLGVECSNHSVPTIFFNGLAQSEKVGLFHTWKITPTFTPTDELARCLENPGRFTCELRSIGRRVKQRSLRVVDVNFLSAEQNDSMDTCIWVAVNLHSHILEEIADALRWAHRRFGRSVSWIDLQLDCK